MKIDLSAFSEEDAAYFREHGYFRQSPEVEARVRDDVQKMNRELAPHRAFIDQRIKETRDLSDKLFSRDHDTIGRILKQHLILENYMTRFLEAASPVHNWRDARLRFAQKMELLPKDNRLVQWLVPGIRSINSIRNSFGHQIGAELSLDAVKACLDVLDEVHPYFNKTYSNPVEVVEDFTELTCRWLPVDKEIDQIFKEARARVTASDAAAQSPAKALPPS